MGVRINTNQHGFLFFRIFWDGKDVAVGTKYTDDGKSGRNTRLLAAKATLIEEELRRGRPLHESLIAVLGDCPPKLVPPRGEERLPQDLTIKKFAAWWLDRLELRRERKSYIRKARSYTENVILKFWGDALLTDVTPARLDDFQDSVLKRRSRKGEPIKIKTARNIVTGYFRAMMVESMRRYGVPTPDPYGGGLRWPDIAEDDTTPDPFTAAERDKVLDYFLRRKRYWYPFLFFQFWTGCRPSETSALRESDVDLKLGTVSIHRSRDEGSESSPKTKRSKRTIHLYPNLLGVLREFRAVKAKARPDDYFFTGPQGGPLYTRDWAEDYGFFDALTRLKVRQRKFYSTRHTFISWSLTAGANPFGLASYCGTSVQMIQEHYGKWIPDRGLDLAILKALNRDLDRDPGLKDLQSSVNSTAYVVRGGGLEPPRVLPH